MPRGDLVGTVVIGSALAIVIGFGIRSFHETATDGTFRGRLPVRVGMSEAEIIAVLGKPGDVVHPQDVPAKSVGHPAYGYAAYAGDCGDLPRWQGYVEQPLVSGSGLPAPTGKLLWYPGKSVLIAGYYLDGNGKLTCVVLGKT